MTRKKTAGRGPAKSQTPAREPAKKPEPELEKLVKPLDSGALKLVLSIIDSAAMVGGDAEVIIKLKLELARAAGVQSGRQ